MKKSNKKPKKLTKVAVLKKFKLTCSECRISYQDESMESTCESECPECGTWNYATKPEKK
jgi:hypothetical protein